MKGEINIVQTSDNFMYLIKSKALGYDLAEDWILFWTFFMPIALILNIYSKETILIYKGLLYIIFIFAMTIIRRNIVSSFKYLLANALIVFLAFIISFTLLEKLLFFTPIIFCLIISINKRNSEVISFYRISVLIWCELLMVLCYFIAFNYSLTSIVNLINFSSINVAITGAVYVCISRMASFMEWEGEFIKGYSKRLGRMKLSCLAFISGTIIFFILLAWSTGLYNVFDMLTSKILALINGVGIQPFKYQSTQQQNTTSDKLNNPLKILQPTGKNNYLSTIVLKIVQFIFFAALALLGIYILIKLFNKIKKFYKSLNLKQENKREEREFIISLDEIIKGFKKKADKFKVQLELPFNMSNSKKIRKLYYKLIKSYKTKDISAYSYNTPIEIERKVREVFKKNISETTSIYEKARYSDSECSKEDVAKMKRFLSL